jgi:pyridoxine 4-dehydrogenase
VNELIREALHPYPTDLAIVSKVAARRDETGAVLAYDEPDQLRGGIEENLATLGVERLAAVNLRVMDASRPGKRFDGQLAALIEARDDGLIDGIGLSNISTEHLGRAVEQTEIVCVQNLFNLADQRSSDLLGVCTLRGIAFVPFFPLGWTRAGRKTVSRSSVLADFGRRLGATPAQIALAWLLDLSPNVLLIPGTPDPPAPHREHPIRQSHNRRHHSGRIRTPVPFGPPRLVAALLPWKCVGNPDHESKESRRVRERALSKRCGCRQVERRTRGHQ